MVKFKLPTRFVIVSPCFENPIQLKRNLIEIATISSGFPLRRSEFMLDSTFKSSCPYSIYLVLNKESMRIDPIDWEKLKSELSHWRLNLCPELQIPSLTDSLFNERTPLRHSPRTGNENAKLQDGVYHFFDCERKQHNETDHLRAHATSSCLGFLD